tara:strand:+ start:44 stop:565 length:522 start_codon:yes stop_codon:yes gene_type:complete
MNNSIPIKIVERAKVVNDLLCMHHTNPKIYRRLIQVTAWDGANTKKFWTGLISVDALNSGERVKEHWYSGSKLADDLIKEYSGSTKWSNSIERIEEIALQIMSKMTWNYTTKKENEILKHNNQDYSMISDTMIESQSHFDKIVVIDSKTKRKYREMMGIAGMDKKKYKKMLDF